MNKLPQEKRDQFFLTDNLKLAAAMTAAGFGLKTAIENGEEVITGISRIIAKGRETLSFRLEPKHQGVKAVDMLNAFNNKVDLPGRVDEILAARGVTAEEYVLIAFDAARSGLNNGSTLMHCGRNQKAMIAKEISGGRTVIYREGASREQLTALINHS